VKEGHVSPGETSAPLQDVELGPGAKEGSTSLAGAVAAAVHVPLKHQEQYGLDTHDPQVVYVLQKVLQLRLHSRNPPPNSFTGIATEPSRDWSTTVDAPLNCTRSICRHIVGDPGGSSRTPKAVLSLCINSLRKYAFPLLLETGK
jgi:hypothetical protein